MTEQFNTLTMTRFGRMLVNVNDVYIGKSLITYGEYSWGEIELLNQILPTDGIVIETGANIGSHTVPLAQKVSQGGRVYAFEPQRIVFQTLAANIALNNCDNVYCYWSGVRDLGGAKTFMIPELSPYKEANFGSPSANQKTDIEVPCSTIDELNLERCNLIKVDVEGMEEVVLRSAENTIKKLRPFIYFEGDRQDKLPALIRLLWSWDYNLWWHTPLLFNAQNYFSVQENIFSGTISANIIAVPKENKLDVTGFKPITDENSWCL